MTRHLRPRLAGFLVTLAVMLCAAPAQATVIDQEHHSFSDSFPDVVCGVSVTHAVVGGGVFHLRVGKGDLDTLFFTLDSYKATDTLTNEANGTFVEVEHNAVYHDVKGTLVEGSIFKAVTIVAGQPISIRDMTGRVVARDRGVIRDTYLFDTQSDHTPGGVYIEELDLHVSGPHPMFADDDAFCAIVRPLLLG
jgi:hypothetical protein